MDDKQDMFVRIMDTVGIDVACVNCIFHGKASISNDWVARYVEKRPDRFLGVAFVTPHYPEEAIPELDRAFGQLGMKFLKLYPNYYGKAIDDPGYFPIFEWADEHGIVIMSHSSYVNSEDILTMPKLFTGLAQRFTRAKWVLAHSGNSRQGQDQAIEAARACPNVYLETATSYAGPGTIEHLVEGAGEDRVLFGSDSPLLDARSQISRIILADISDDAKRKVLGLNAIRLLGLEF